jgi:hypothetical protein
MVRRGHQCGVSVFAATPTYYFVAGQRNCSEPVAFAGYRTARPTWRLAGWLAAEFGGPEKGWCVSPFVQPSSGLDTGRWRWWRSLAEPVGDVAGRAGVCLFMA